MLAAKRYGKSWLIIPPLTEAVHEEDQDPEHQAPTLGDMTQEVDQMQGSVDDVSR